VPTGASPQLEVVGLSTVSVLKSSIFLLILVLGPLEGLSASGNMLSMERDWIIAAAAPNGRPYEYVRDFHL
jgi:iron-regulated transporter 1